MMNDSQFPSNGRSNRSFFFPSWHHVEDSPDHGNSNEGSCVNRFKSQCNDATYLVVAEPVRSAVGPRLCCQEQYTAETLVIIIMPQAADMIGSTVKIENHQHRQLRWLLRPPRARTNTGQLTTIPFCYDDNDKARREGFCAPCEQESHSTIHPIFPDTHPHSFRV
jgi:hypothetical protein